MKNLTKFETQCEAASQKLFDGRILMLDEPNRVSEVLEDDGYLHVVRRGQRAVFNVSNNQDDTGKVQNEKMRLVLAELGIKLTDEQWKRVAVEEVDEDEDECPHCGRSGCPDW